MSAMSFAMVPTFSRQKFKLQSTLSRLQVLHTELQGKERMSRAGEGNGLGLFSGQQTTEGYVELVAKNSLIDTDNFGDHYTFTT
jgi:hypothetical protein